MTAARSDGWDLIEAAQAGDRDAYGQLYTRYAPGVSRFVGSRTGDRMLAEDLTSETFARALRRIDSVSYQGRDAGAWFTTIARNLITDHVKSSRYQLDRLTADIADADDRHDSPEQAAISRACLKAGWGRAKAAPKVLNEGDI
jgi:RNA polymerase sigma-70 factor (ECF subfamily)